MNFKAFMKVARATKLYVTVVYHTLETHRIMVPFGFEPY